MSSARWYPTATQLALSTFRATGRDNESGEEADVGLSASRNQAIPQDVTLKGDRPGKPERAVARSARVVPHSGTCATPDCYVILEL